MRALVFSDIHGSMVAAHTIKEQAEKIQPEYYCWVICFIMAPVTPCLKHMPPATAKILNSFADKIIAIGGKL